MVRDRVLREREAVLRFAVLRGFAAARFGAERLAVERLAVARLAAGLLREAAAPLDFARDVRAFVPLDFARALVLRPPAGLRAPLAAALVPPPSVDHLPDIMRCAASATASAISEPSFVALAATLLAACWAVSAASRPASRILRRAAGLALIAAAAAARPAASISLLIAALANLSVVALPEDDDRLADGLEADPELGFLEDFFGDFAITFSPSVAWERHFSAITVPE